MVRCVLSKYGDKPPNTDEEDRKIQTIGPINPISEILSILNNSMPQTMTRKSISDLQRLALDATDLRELICCAVSQGKYRDSEWCTTKAHGPWYACDSYELKRKEYIEAANKELVVHYYIKFCINKLGNLICTFSCHLSR